MTQKGRRAIVFMIIASMGGIAFGGLYWYFQSRATQVVLTNSGKDDLREVVLHLSGHSYQIGDVKADSTRVYRLYPEYESHLEIEFTSLNGTRLRLKAGGYFGPGIRAKIEVTMDVSAIHSVKVFY